jgi:hypothetical protein
MATGTAINIAMVAASNVPKTRGQTNGRKSLPLLTSSGEAVMPGRPCTVRKIATPARITRMSSPALSESPEKMRSPGRRIGFLPGAGACVLVTGGAFQGWGSREPDPPLGFAERSSRRTRGTWSQLTLIVSIAAWTFLPKSVVSGADPALSAAAA